MIDSEIHLTGPPAALQEAQNILTSLDSCAIDPTAIDKSGSHLTIRLHLSDKQLDTILTVLGETKALSGLEILVRNLEQAEAALGNEPFQPVPGITIQPWTDTTATEHLPNAILLDAGSAFGAGTHPTTRLCLSVLMALKNGDFPGLNLRTPKALDVGCGSGILGIAATKLGLANTVLGVEIDPEAAKIAKKNVKLNQQTDHIEIQSGSLEDVHGRFDLILANLIPAVLQAHAQQISAFLADNGLLITSGFQGTQGDNISAKFSQTGLQLITRQDNDGWGALLMKQAD